MFGLGPGDGDGEATFTRDALSLVVLSPAVSALPDVLELLLPGPESALLPLPDPPLIVFVEDLPSSIALASASVKLVCEDGLEVTFFWNVSCFNAGTFVVGGGGIASLSGSLVSLDTELVLPFAVREDFVEAPTSTG